MKFSLVLATCGRTDELKIFLNSLQKQTYKNYELIVIDQNDHNLVKQILELYEQDMEIVYLKSEKGLSKARNVGLNHISGEIVAFPDDDCVYLANNFLEMMLNDFVRINADGITAKSWDLGQEEKIPLEQGNSEPQKINLYNVWTRSISYTVFLKSEVIKSVGNFDEKLGVGSGTKYGSGEETDYLIRALKNNFRLYHSNYLYVLHPALNFNDNNLTNKAYNYSVGRKYVLRKHGYSQWFILANIYYPLIKLIMNFYKPKKVRYHWAQFLGRFKHDG